MYLDEVTFSDADEHYMLRALALARDSIGQASPNPQVGCVLVQAGAVIGEGAHFYDRFDHAEIAALKQAAQGQMVVRGATAYVTLEPCSHHGRTGPCADALIAAGVGRCVVATPDPNPQVSGRGIARLRNAGITVEVGLFEDRARTLNNAFALSITRNRPFITLKAGLSVDGMLAPPPHLRTRTEPFFLTGEASRAEVQQMRHRSDAILTGIGTVLADDPQMTDRSGLPRRRRLQRILLDSRLRIPVSSRLLHPVEQDLWIFCAADAPEESELALTSAGARITRIEGLPIRDNEVASSSRPDLRQVLQYLHEARILSVLLEAGSALNGAFLRQDLVDEAALYYSALELGRGAVPFAEDHPGPFALEQRLIRVNRREVGVDVCVSGLLHDPWRTP